MAIAGFDSVLPYSQMVCLGRYVRQEDDIAEMGLVVKEDHQGLGIGAFLSQKLIESAKLHGIKKLSAHVARHNIRMLKIYTSGGFKIEEAPDSNQMFASFDIPPI